MFDEDQAERTGESTANGDRVRADRLAEIVDEHGWPTHSMVGTDGGTAAWLIAQHADFDVGSQARIDRSSCSPPPSTPARPMPRRWRTSSIASP